MIVVEHARGTPEWRAAHAGHITPSDCPELLAGVKTKGHRALVERLVLDFEGLGNHTVDDPDPWAIEHEESLVAALSIYRKARPGTEVELVGFIESRTHSWLGASPHALLDDDGVLLLRPHRTLRGFYTFREAMPNRARVQLLMFATRRGWCDSVDVWDGKAAVPDKCNVRRVMFDREWLTEHVLQRVTSFWHEVEEMLKVRRQGVAARS